MACFLIVSSVYWCNFWAQLTGFSNCRILTTIIPLRICFQLEIWLYHSLLKFPSHLGWTSASLLPARIQLYGLCLLSASFFLCSPGPTLCCSHTECSFPRRTHSPFFQGLYPCSSLCLVTWTNPSGSSEAGHFQEAFCWSPLPPAPFLGPFPNT